MYHYAVGASPLRDATGASKISYDTTGVGVNGQPPVAQPDYTVAAGVVNRTINVGTDSLTTTQQVIGTIINDLIAFGPFR